MTTDPIAAALLQLAACRDQLAALDAREAAHHADLSSQLSRLENPATTLKSALGRLEALDQQVTGLTRHLTSTTDGNGDDGYQPRPAPAWHKLTAEERRAPVAELHDWAERVYRPGYGHLAAALSPCWPAHDLCLYALDIASQLWCALYLQPQRTAGLLSAQAEYQVRILPALAAQLAAETSRCGHHLADRPGSIP
jgi:hypothetical protein